MTTRHLDTGTPELLASVTDHVATITLNRPEKRNALGEQLSPALRLHDCVEPTIPAMAGQIAEAAPIALRYMKENHNRAQVSDLKTTLAMEGDRMIRTMQTEDHKRAAKAFFAKEKPVFEGR